ncbi:xylulokinase [Lacrimispora sp. NSJ-141]|uniref:Xylulose kinase n=1 Tax=Lientehia hominis TaxID=2897778 RepID=A0AAP2RIP4_9FIRM|nr:xylulokinase [Lientehia hominis]MCD2492108.1 xylulokinase [Lientehia hominis]
MAYLMGIDLGTSSLKTIIIDEAGNVKAVSARPYQFASPCGGYAEHDPREWWQACCETVKEALDACGAPAASVKGVSFSGQMHGAVLLDKDYQVIRPAILHCDARSAVQVEEIKRVLGMDKVRELIMNPVYTGFLLPSLMWVRDNEPENYEKVRHVFLPKDYLKFRMTGEVSSDYSDASATLAFDIKKNCWSEEILRAVDVPMDIFPRCYGTDEAAGTVCEAASRETGLSTSTVVVAGGGDQVMQGIGNGITQVGSATSNIGTSGQVSFQSDTPIMNPALSTNTFCGYKKGRWFTMGAIMNAGLSLKWFNSLFETADFNQINEQVAKVRPGSGGVIFLPYLNGERTPHVNPNLSGMFLGVNLNTGRPEMTRAVMEGVAFALYQCIEVCGNLGLEADNMVASGGGARSGPWLQIQADIFNIPLKVADTEEQAGLGSAIAAGVGAGIYRDIEEGCRAVVKYKDMLVVPNAAAHEAYEEYYQLYKDTYEAGRDVLQRVTLMGRRQ